MQSGVMADVLLSALLPVVMEKVTDSVLQRFGVMWGIHDKLKKLERMLSAIHNTLEDAELRQVRDPAVKRWLEGLKDECYEADDILDEFKVEAMRRKAEIQVDMTRKVRSFFSFHNPVWFRFKMGRQLNDIVEKIEAGELAFNSLLPSEHELKDHYNTSRETIRKALNLLSQNGYIQKIFGGLVSSSSFSTSA